MRNSVAVGRPQLIPIVNTNTFRDFSKSQALAARMILTSWFDHLEKRFSYKEVKFKMFCLPVKTSCLPAKIINETPSLTAMNNILLNLKACTSFSLL